MCSRKITAWVFFCIRKSRVSEEIDPLRLYFVSSGSSCRYLIHYYFAFLCQKYFIVKARVKGKNKGKSYCVTRFSPSRGMKDKDFQTLLFK